MQRPLFLVALVSLTLFTVGAFASAQCIEAPISTCGGSDCCGSSVCCAASACGSHGRPWFRPAPAPVCCTPFAVGPYIMGPIAPSPSEASPHPAPPSPPITSTPKPAPVVSSAVEPKEPTLKPEAKEASKPELKSEPSPEAKKTEAPSPELPLVPAPEKKSSIDRALRTWADDSGNHHLVARFVEMLPDGTVRLQQLDGTLVRVAIQRLSKTDRTYLSGRQARLASK